MAKDQQRPASSLSPGQLIPTRSRRLRRLPNANIWYSARSHVIAKGTCNSMRKILPISLLILSVPAIVLYQRVYYFNEYLVLLVCLAGLPLTAYLFWWGIYSSGLVGTRTQRCVGPFFFACVTTPALAIAFSYLNQIGGLHSERVLARLIDGEYVSEYRIRGRTYAAYTNLEVSIDSGTERFSIRVPNAQIANIGKAQHVYLCRRKGLLHFTYYEFATLDRCH